MWILIGALILIILFQVIVERRSRQFQQRRSDGFAQALAVGKKPQFLWRVWAWVSGATVAGFVGSAGLGLNEMYGALVAALLTILYLEKMRYPKILITTKPCAIQVAHEELYSTTITLDEKSQVLLDGQRLELQDEENRKRLVLLRQNFPNVDFDTLCQWLTECQQDQHSLALEKATTIGGFSAPAGISDLVFSQAGWSSRPLFLFVWVGLLIQLMERIF